MLLFIFFNVRVKNVATVVLVVFSGGACTNVFGLTFIAVLCFPHLNANTIAANF